MTMYNDSRDARIVVAVLILATFIILSIFFGGCTTMGGATPKPVPGLLKFLPEQAKSITTSSGLALNLASLGVAGSLFAIAMGAGKMGWAALVACIGSSVYSIVMIQYAWLVALIGLAIGAGIVVVGVRKNKEDKENLGGKFIRGFENAKDLLCERLGHEKYHELRGDLNTMMGIELDDKDARLVSKTKTALKELDSAKSPLLSLDPQGGKEVFPNEDTKS